MSERFTREKRRPTQRDADGDLATRARQQMRAAVSTLRAGFTGHVLARRDEPTEGDASAEEPRFRRMRR